MAATFLVLCSCSSLPFKKDRPEVVLMDEVDLKLTVPKKRVEYIEYNNKVFSRVFDQDVLRSEALLNTDFKVKLELKKLGENIVYLMKTTSKSGIVPLEDMIFPEPGKTLKLTLDSKARVLNAEKPEEKDHTFSKDGIAYIPVLFLPENKISVGDIWENVHLWKGDKGVSYLTKLRSKLLKLYKCELDQVCAFIEVNGSVRIPDNNVLRVNLKSSVEGRVILNTNLGSVLWSNFLVKDRGTTELGAAVTRNCLESRLSDPIVRIWKFGKAPSCDLDKVKDFPK